MFFILHALFFIIYRFYSNFVEIWAPRSNFALKSAYKKLAKNKKNFRTTDPNIFQHVSGNTGICFVFFWPYAFVWEKGKTMDFSENIVVCDVKVAIRS